MINLLPSETKKLLKSSRTNLLLLKYLFILLFAGVFIAVAYFAANLNLDNIKRMDTPISNGSSSSPSTETSAQIEQAITDLTNADNIINQQTPFSKILFALAKMVPSNVVLSSFIVDSNSVNTSLNIKLRAKSQDDVTKLNRNFQDTSVFSDYQLVSNNPSTLDPTYPIDLTVSVRINKAGLK
jgi:Tfp pilus assembly protein PilN